jgi:hypothetical protein
MSSIWHIFFREETMKSSPLLIAAGISGLVMGVIAGVPILGIVNCLCCLGLWGSGILAVMLYRRLEPANPDISGPQGATVGALAGVVGAFVGAIFGAIFSGIQALSSLEMLRQIPNASEYLRNIPLESFTSGGFNIFGLVCRLVVYVAFGALGGFIAAAFIWKKK